MSEGTGYGSFAELTDMIRAIGLCAGLVLVSIGMTLGSARAKESRDTKPAKLAVEAKRNPSATPGKVALPHTGTPMQVTFVRSSQPGCEPNCPEWISAQGSVNADSVAQFKKVLNKLGQRKLPILIESRGGAVDESLVIGRLIRSKGLDVVVTKTVFQGCAPKDAGCNKLKAQGIRLGLPEARISVCASSCAFILAGGVKRYVGPMTFVGVHQIVSFRTTWKVLQKFKVVTHRVFGVPVETTKTLLSSKKIDENTVKLNTSDDAYKKSAKYFAEMGITDDIMPLVKSATPDKIHVLTFAELKSTNMATDFVQGETLLLGTQPVALAPAPTGDGTAWAKWGLTPGADDGAVCQSVQGLSMSCPVRATADGPAAAAQAQPVPAPAAPAAADLARDKLDDTKPVTPVN